MKVLLLYCVKVFYFIYQPLNRIELNIQELFIQSCESVQLGSKKKSIKSL